MNKPPMALAFTLSTIILHAAGLSTASALAADIVGSYQVTGRNPDGTSYQGTLKISSAGSLYKLAWQAGASYTGVGILQGDTLSIGWGGSRCNVVTYRAQADGSLQGSWTSSGQDGLGTEQATRTGGTGGGGIAGSYTVAGNNPNGSGYQGTLVVRRQGEVYRFSWKAGNTFEGVGIKQGDTVAVGWGSESCGVMLYQVNAGGGLSGVWASQDQNQTGTEEAIRP